MNNRKRVTLTFETDDRDNFNDEAFLRHDFLQELRWCVNNPYEDTFVVKVEDADVPQKMSVAEESRIRVPWRWLEDFAREYTSEQYAEFVLAAKRAYISSVEKMYGQLAQEHPERSEE